MIKIISLNVFRLEMYKNNVFLFFLNLILISAH
jgi:hypothetical protein